MPFANTTGQVSDSKIAVASAAGGYVTIPTDAGGVVRQAHIVLASAPISITDALAYGSLQLVTFPEGRLRVLDVTAVGISIVTTSAIASTINSGVTGQFGLGSAAASAVTLATTMINLSPGTGQTPTAWTSSTVINVAPASINSVLAATTNLDGSSTAISMYLNLSITTGTDIDADGTVAVSGDIYVTYAMVGDY